MLLKYLNELDEAVRRVSRDPDPESLALCARRLQVLDDYLATQIEPVRLRGRQILEHILARIPELEALELRARLNWMGAGPATPAPALPETGRAAAGISDPAA